MGIEANMTKDDELALKIRNDMSEEGMSVHAYPQEFARRLRAALAEGQEPVAAYDEDGEVTWTRARPPFHTSGLLYVAPPALAERVKELEAELEQAMPQPCCQEYKTCNRRQCIPRLEFLLNEAIDANSKLTDEYVSVCCYSDRQAGKILAAESRLSQVSERVREAAARICEKCGYDSIQGARDIRNMDLQALIAAESTATVDRYSIPDFLRNQRNLANEQKALAAEKGLELASQAPNSFESRLWCPTYRLHLKRKCPDCTCGHIPSIAAAEGERRE